MVNIPKRDYIWTSLNILAKILKNNNGDILGATHRSWNSSRDFWGVNTLIRRMICRHRQAISPLLLTHPHPLHSKEQCTKEALDSLWLMHTPPLPFEMLFSIILMPSQSFLCVLTEDFHKQLYLSQISLNISLFRYQISHKRFFRDLQTPNSTNCIL